MDFVIRLSVAVLKQLPMNCSLFFLLMSVLELIDVFILVPWLALLKPVHACLYPYPLDTHPGLC